LNTASGKSAINNLGFVHHFPVMREPSSNPDEPPLPEPYHRRPGSPELTHRWRGPTRPEWTRLISVLAFALLIFFAFTLWKQQYDAALIQEARIGNTIGVEKWLAKGADPNAWDSKGMTSLMHAAANGHLKTVRFLTSHGADPTRMNKSRQTACVLAELNHHTNVVVFLRRLGVE
jgi:hypothetical protein